MAYVNPSLTYQSTPTNGVVLPNIGVPSNLGGAASTSNPAMASVNYSQPAGASPQTIWTADNLPASTSTAPATTPGQQQVAQALTAAAQPMGTGGFMKDYATAMKQAAIDPTTGQAADKDAMNQAHYDFAQAQSMRPQAISGPSVGGMGYSTYGYAHPPTTSWAPRYVAGYKPPSA